MKTLYYYFRWLFRQYKCESIHIFFVGAIINIIGLSMNFLGVALIHTRYDENGILQIYKNEYWTVLGDKFLMVGTSIVVVSSFIGFVVQPIKKSFNRFKQEQRDLLKTIDRGR